MNVIQRRDDDHNDDDNDDDANDDFLMTTIASAQFQNVWFNNNPRLWRVES